MTTPLRLSAALIVPLALVACAATGGKPAQFANGEFEATNTYSRTFPASEGATCEAARRALLSQGYVVSAAGNDLVNARKSFQPEHEVHYEIEVRVVCAHERRGTGGTLAFVSALQDRYTLKKSNNSASVGVPAIGSLSLPFTAGEDSLVKVGSETITSASFYDRFFKLVSAYIVAEPPRASVPVPAVATVAPLDTAASAPLLGPVTPAASAPR